jgi:sensor histidine kinase YesM
LIVSLSLILVLVIPRLLFDVHPPHHKHHFPTLPHRPHHGFLNWFELSNDIFPFLLVIFFSLILKINERWRYAENEKTRVQLSFLQAQINPHFLFNTLNSIYSLAIQKSDYTSTAIVKLDGMMRYVLYETKHDFISLQKELDYLSDYIELQKIRLNDTIMIDFKIEGSAEGKQIAPLILVPFVENAFKHGVNPEENATIMIHISIKENNLELSVKNKKVTNNSLTNTEAGLGIENTETRLQLLYPGRYQLSIQDLNDEFFVYLVLNFQ